MIQTLTRVHQRLLLVTLSALMALGAGSVGAQSGSPSPVASPSGDLTIEAELASARAELAALTVERDRLQDLLGAFDSLYDPMEADRQLLVELRKPLPEDRRAAEAYLARIQQLAIASDPGRLGQPASRVLETAPVFLDWRDGTYGSQAEQDAAYLTTGASGFRTDFDELEKAILLTVANRLDALLTMHDRIR